MVKLKRVAQFLLGKLATRTDYRVRYNPTTSWRTQTATEWQNACPQWRDGDVLVSNNDTRRERVDGARRVVDQVELQVPPAVQIKRRKALEIGVELQRSLQSNLHRPFGVLVGARERHLREGHAKKVQVEKADVQPRRLPLHLSKNLPEQRHALTLIREMFETDKAFAQRRRSCDLKVSLIPLGGSWKVAEATHDGADSKCIPPCCCKWEGCLHGSVQSMQTFPLRSAWPSATHCVFTAGGSRNGPDSSSVIRECRRWQSSATAPFMFLRPTSHAQQQQSPDPWRGRRSGRRGRAG